MECGYGRYTGGMNEQQLAQLIRNVKAAQESLTYLLNDLQDLAHGEPVVTVTDDNPKLKRFVTYAKKKLMCADGDWIYWTDLRPAHRDRAEYGEPLWEALTEDPDLEAHRAGAHRKIRYNPLI